MEGTRDILIDVQFPMEIAVDNYPAGGVIYMQGKTELSQVEEAPESGYVEAYENPPYVPQNSSDIGYIYCVRTIEDHYAKFKIVSVDDSPTEPAQKSTTISWLYQPNGSRNF